MPIPSKQEGENPTQFMQRCMTDEVMQKEYPNEEQRTAICMSKSAEGLPYVTAADMVITQGESATGKFKYKDPFTGELYYYEYQGVKKKNGHFLIYVGEIE